MILYASRRVDSPICSAMADCVRGRWRGRSEVATVRCDAASVHEVIRVAISNGNGNVMRSSAGVRRGVLNDSTHFIAPSIARIVPHIVMWMIEYIIVIAVVIGGAAIGYRIARGQYDE